MNGPRLTSLTIQDFRSIRGSLQLPLDANVVLIHGENGAGKTSVLSAIELALTGGVIALQRADVGYAAELTNKAADAAKVFLSAEGLGGPFGGEIDKSGKSSLKTLPARLNSFFSERCYLPQSLLGQLLQIYQDSGTAVDSPLSRFVTELLGLDRLDAIETGLQPVLDLRKLRKTTDAYARSEAEEVRFNREILALQETIQALATKTRQGLTDLAAALSTLDMATNALTIEQLDTARATVDLSDEVRILQDIENQRRALRSIFAEGQDALGPVEQDQQALVDAHHRAEAALGAWQAGPGVELDAVRKLAADLDPSAQLDIADPQEFVSKASPLVETLRTSLAERLSMAKLDRVRGLAIEDEKARLTEQLTDIDSEIALAADNPTGLANVLAEITAHVAGEICPVCDRDFSETGQGTLSGHLNQKVRTLSSAAARLLDLSRSRSIRQTEIAAIEAEEMALAARRLSQEDFDVLDRRRAIVMEIADRLRPMREAAGEGSILLRQDADTRRALSSYQLASRVQLSLRDNIASFAETRGFDAMQPLETAGAAKARLEVVMNARTAAAERRMEAKRTAAAQIDQLKADHEKLAIHRARCLALETERKKVVDALKRAAQIRKDGQAMEAAVRALRAKMIRREFNDRLNKLWRDLFVRLAPNEPFVPAFLVPDQPTHRLQPQLITHHRDGVSGGAPGAMLSAGNLNTAALTLFVALHLTMKPRLPWLILDDPVQSMDDVHIAHFAALLRTLSRQHGRQIVVAVHDRQLFDYLTLELSPASPGEALLAIELIKTRGKNTERLIDRRLFRKEAALRFVA